MRLVTYVDVCNEVGYGEYSANDTTAFITQKALIGGEKHQYFLLGRFLITPRLTVSAALISRSQLVAN